MLLSEIENPLIILVGPTAVGKTALSIELAQHLNAEIISSDSRLFYRGMDIGTAKPTRRERSLVPHHLIDVADPHESWSLALFQQAAHQVIDDIHTRQRLPLMVGGTGQYVHAITHGWHMPPQAPDDSLRDVLNRWAQQISPERLHQKLALIDPPAAAGIDWRNQRRTVRALEVIFRTGKRFSAQRSEGKPRNPTLQIGLWRPREEIFQRVDERIETMFAQGFIDEVRGLLAAGVTPDMPGMASIGYREVCAHLRGEMTLDEVKARMRQLTHQFVRRQSNWFKQDDPEIHWFDVRQPAVIHVILDTIQTTGHWRLP